MLKKLLKYDLKYMLKNMIVFYALSIFFAIVSRIFLSLNQTVVIKIVSQVCVGCMFSMVFSILINTMMRSWVRFRDFIYKDESYLTHTLPVTKKDIYESKFIQTLIFTFVSFLIIVISLFITYYSKDIFSLLSNYINEMLNGINISTKLFIIMLSIVLLAEIINGIQSGYLGIILGHRKNNNKIRLSVLYGFIIYIASQIILTLTFLILGLFNNDILKLFTSNVILNINVIKQAIIFVVIIYNVIIILMNILCVKMLNKGVNIE